MRYSDKELNLMKGLFADNDELLKAIRKVFLQMPLNPIDTSCLSVLKGKGDTEALLRKAFLPELDGEAPFHQVIDLWMTVEIKDKSPESVRIIAQAREGLIDYLDQQLKVLFGAKQGKISFANLTSLKGKTDDQITIDLINRNTIIAHVEMQLNQFKILAGQKDESVEETKARLLKDSSK